MPLDIYDIEGNHIGIVHKKYYEAEQAISAYMIAITDLYSHEININMDEIKAYMASLYNCTTLFGKVKEEDLEKVIKRKMEEVEDGKYKSLEYNNFIKLLFLINHYGDKFDEIVEMEIPKDKIKGYVLLDINKIHLHEHKLVINEELDYIENEVVEGILPICGKVVDYPVVTTEIMGISGLFLGSDLTDLGGRNHVHITSIKMKSGNFHHHLDIPVMLNVRRNMNIQLYIINNKIKSVFCDGVIYRFGKI
ncbi:hypothetical protein [Sporosalibacterium faouarense]|uniref:hypothetical protein n=1 Tax=Sporosalibacterium faouarense TaxID=516123 RepID=UPI00141D3A38|nr:hypothetical protein [Sporosalibacterium faouarense]MTI49861.1 hypothetical protein [Bacillota bacterium]